MNQLENNLDFALKVRDWMEDKNAKDIKVLDIHDVSSLADYFIICSGSSDRQVTAIADNIQDQATAIGMEPKNVEGFRTGRWILLDYYDVIVHVFHDEERAFYNLERLWKDAKVVE